VVTKTQHGGAIMWRTSSGSGPKIFDQAANSWLSDVTFIVVGLTFLNIMILDVKKKERR
jgi:preprotein translocase subunit SecG